MKQIFIFCLLCSAAFTGNAQTTTGNAAVATTPPVPKTMIVEASCSECKFGMKETGCQLAVRIKGKVYLVTGAGSIDTYGDAHGPHGMCNEIRKAEVEGEIKNGKFVAKHFKLLPTT